MKKLFFFFMFLSSVVLLSSCDQIFGPKEGPNDLGGSTDVDYAKVGEKFTGSLKINGTYKDVDNSITVTKNDNGVVTLHITANISNVSELAPLASLLPPSVKDENGNINADMKLKITTDGIQDYNNKDGKAHTIVKYSANVGDTYKLTKSDGTTITRTVTAKSTIDDFPWGLMLIKTITVEQDSRIPGVKKIIMKANHKFGLVFVSFVMEDGTEISSVII